MALDIGTNTLRTITPHFQRSINLSYDVGDADYVANYIPTPNGAKALATIFDNTLPDCGQRAHVFHAAYGSGKSLLGLVLSTLASRDKRSASAISVVQDRLQRALPEETERVNAYLARRDTRILPVILSGDEGHFATAIVKALSRTLDQHDIDLHLPTQFQAALNVIELWSSNYPDAYSQLKSCLSEKDLSLDQLKTELRALEQNALALFSQLYPRITAGARFDPNTGMSPEHIFRATVQALQKDFNYNGILVIWDEFGRFLDARVGEAFGKEAALLQSFAEFCNRSGSYPVHLVLITHRLISGYATELPLSYQQEWARISERFLSHDISSDPAVIYRLIAEALSTPDPDPWQAFLEKHHAKFEELTALTLELSLFDELDDVFLRQQIIERAWPLHPLSVYALPRLASRVAQNERTLFTFLAAREPGTLIEQLVKHEDSDEWWLIRLNVIWDYFAEAIRSNTGAGGTHTIWLGTMHALSKVQKDDVQAQSLIKTLAILLIVGEINVQADEHIGRVVPTTELLTWALGISSEETSKLLDVLAKRRVIIYRRSDGYWTFTRGSDIDLDIELNKAIERQVLAQPQIRQILEQDFPLPFHLPRRHNQEKAMTRFFKGFYRWPNEMKNVGTEAFLKQQEGYGYADGAIIYVLVTNAAEREQAIETVQNLPAGRVIYVIPDHPLLIMESVQELFALRDLSSDAAFMQRDERLPTEIAFLVEDAQRRLARSLRPFLELDSLKATWWYYDACWHPAHENTKAISQLLSSLCDQWFSQTPILNNELVNRHEPTIQQERAIEKVIDALLDNPYDALPPDLGLSGHGPDWLIVQTLLKSTHLISPRTIGLQSLQRPAKNPELAHIWDIVQEFLKAASRYPQELSILIDKLQLPPYGLRRGVLPILLTAMLRLHLPALTIRQRGKMITPITGQIFIMLCNQPDQFTIELSPLDARRSILWKVLEQRVGEFLTEQERTQQPFNALSVGLLRWLQSLPRYCRETSQVSDKAQKLRVLLRKAQRDPAQVLAFELLDLLEDGSTSPDDKEKYSQMLTERLSSLMDEIATAYQTLLYSLDRLAGEIFGVDATDGYAALHLWLSFIEERAGKSLDLFRLSDKLAQRLVELANQQRSSQGDHFWNQLSKVVLGISLNDWNDFSNENFKQKLEEAKVRVEHEIFELTNEEAAIKLSVALPTKDEQTYRFRQSNLSPQGQRILQNFKSTLEIAGRPLSLDEKRQIALALVEYVMRGVTPDE